MKPSLLLTILLLIIADNKSFAASLEPQNYFASLRADKVNVRAGPSSNYLIKYTFQARGVPVKVINKYDNWNEIEDFEGESGWVNQNLLTRRRTVIIKTKDNFINLHLAASKRSRILLRLENDVIAGLIKCIQDWCGIKIAGEKGWVESKDIWGVDERDFKN